MSRFELLSIREGEDPRGTALVGVHKPARRVRRIYLCSRDHVLAHSARAILIASAV